MNIVSDLYKKGIRHHAYFLEGDAELNLVDVQKFLESELSFEVKANPDYWYSNVERFGIDEGRYLKQLQSQRPIGGSRRIIVISFKFITGEAQNALLKIFEEPNPGVIFFILAPTADALLPTLRSRLFIVENKQTKRVEVTSVDDFLKGTIDIRLNTVSKMIKDKDKEGTVSFINALESYVYAHDLHLSEVAYQKVLEDIMEFRKYLRGNAPSVKMILEYLCVSIPQKKDS